MRGKTEAAFGHLRPLSVALGWLLFGQRTTLCALAWRNCATNRVAWWWVRVFGVVHCSQSGDWDARPDRGNLR